MHRNKLSWMSIKWLRRHSNVSSQTSPNISCDASWMLLTAARVTAADALRIGLVQQVVPAAELMDVAMTTAQDMCALSQVSLQMIKQVLRHHRDLALKESLDHGAVLSRLLNLGDDVDEGIAAFREKRDTNFGNRWPDAP